jgi:DNA-binding PucR family transcriptional regulator
VSELAVERLAPLDAETANSRARLEATLLAWLRHAGTIAAVARELEVHPQTVRYRLGRLRELFGAALDEPDARFELELVLRARAA